MYKTYGYGLILLGVRHIALGAGLFSTAGVPATDRRIRYGIYRSLCTSIEHAGAFGFRLHDHR